MKYTVILTPQAEAELMELWMSAADQAEMTIAADTIDRLLKHDPHHVGVLLFETVRRIRKKP
jgi:hypothetical protein